jgi:AraC-like DNA-binding protein
MTTRDLAGRIMPITRSALLGQSLRRAALEIDPFRLRLEVCRPNQEVEPANDSSADILIVAQGSATLVLEDGIQPCLPLSVSYRGPGYPKREKAGEAGLVALRISVRGAFAQRVEADYFAGNGGPRLYPCAALDDVPARIVDEWARADASPLLLDGLLRLLIAKAARFEAGGRSLAPPAWLAAAVASIESSYREPLRIEDVADEAGVTPAHFSRVFHRFLGQSAKRFLSSQRLRQGASLLAGTSLPISEIALSLGFSDQAHFTREFRCWTGKPPDTFRREHRSTAKARMTASAHQAAPP